jgi:hypothetical protein
MGSSNPGAPHDGVGPGLGLGVPAYFGPWELAHWHQLLDAAPTVVVINPDSGPGMQRHQGYRELVNALHDRRVTVLGYVTTSSLRRPDAALCDDASRHGDWYGVDGVFWDEVHLSGPDPSAEDRLETLASCSAALRLAAPTVAFNTGVDVVSVRTRVPYAWWVTFEGSAAQYRQRFDGAAPGLDDGSARHWHLVHSVAAAHRNAIARRIRAAGVGLAYVTGDAMPNPWDVFDAGLQA